MFSGSEVNTLNLKVTEVDNKKATPDVAHDAARVTPSPVVGEIPVFRTWKGEEANKALEAAWRVSGGDKAFILTMYAENNTFELKRKHPKRNGDGSWDYAMGLNSYYHLPMIKKIMAGKVTEDEAMKYHWDIYIASYNNPRKTSCGKTAFCGYNRINNKDIKNSIIFPN